MLSTAAPPANAPVATRLPPITARMKRAPHDTVAGCRALAAASLAQEAAETTDNRRRSHALSAATWLKRANMLERLEISHAARLSKDIIAQ
jgi:hypothetical protein